MTSRLEALEPLVGRTTTTVDGFAVEAGKVEEFARSIHDDNPAYRDAEAAAQQGFAAIPAPLTFTRTSYFPRYRTGQQLDLGFDTRYTLHGEHRYEFERPVLVGDVLTGETTVTEAYEREGARGGTMTFALVETAYHDENGETVLTEQATVIETGGGVAEDRGPDSVDGPTQGADPWSVGDTDEDPTAPTPCVPGELAVGDDAAPRSVGPLSRRHFVRYAGASGDLNPIHYDEPYATGAANPSVFGQGMFTAGVAAHAAADWLGLGAIEAFGVRFQSRVWPGDVVVAGGTVTDVERTPDGERVHCDLRVDRHRPDAPDETEAVLTGETTAHLRD